MGHLRGCWSVVLAASCIACTGNATGGVAASAPPGETVELVRAAALPLTGSERDYDSLVALVGDARVVLLGEATHGTHEFYQERARITRRLVTERGFSAVAIEGDWPDAYRANRYIRGIGTDQSAEQALGSFSRFPEWMWRNTDVRDLLQWLRQHNATRPADERVGFYGLDVYSLYPAIDEVLRYLGEADPALRDRARALYACFEPSRPDAQRYGQAAGRGARCQSQAAEVHEALRQRAASRPADPEAAEALFSAERNAQSVVNAEAYFRTSYEGSASTWNLRDQAMASTLAALDEHLVTSTGRPARIVVWAHNTHAGDARVTESGEQGELNIGQLMRQRHGARAVLVGFHTYEGTVLAADEWDSPGRVKTVRPALPESYSALFHATGLDRFLVPLRGGGAAVRALSEPRLQRAIGVIYRPDTERQSHYFTARLGQQFDAVIFIDRTTAVTPLP